MAIKNDYLLDMIARFVECILLGLERGRDGLPEESAASYESVVGSVLDMDAETALNLAPESLVMMMQISAVDDSLAAYAVYALNQAASQRAEAEPGLATLRAEQAAAIASAYGFAPDVVPPEVEEALATGKR